MIKNLESTIINQNRIMKNCILILLGFTLFLSSCSDNNFLVKEQTYQFDEVVIVNSGGTNYFHEGSATIYDNKVKLSTGKINNTFNIENVEYNNTSDEKVVIFGLSLNGDVCKAEFHKTDDNIIYLKVMKDDYQENVMLPCDNFIQIGKKYSFDSNSITKGRMRYGYDEGFAVFSQNSLTITVGDICKTFNILKSSYFKNEDSPNYHADFTLSIDGEECEAQFGMGGAHRGLFINFPKPSNEIQYMLLWNH
jgi:hypothetical protein